MYLPIEPHFPADRIATTLSRAECRLVLTEPGSTTTLDQALDSLPGVADGCFVDDGLRRGPRRRRPRRRRRAGPARLHLLHLRLHRRAQGRDVRARGHAQPPLRQDRRPGDRRGRRWSPRPRRSASTSRCGSWSSALLVGGRTLLVEQEVILDVERFVDTIVDGRVAVLQVVPSYLEVVAVLPGAAPPRAARPAVRVGHRRGAEEGARAALVRGPARRSSWSTPTG